MSFTHPTTNNAVALHMLAATMPFSDDCPSVHDRVVTTTFPKTPGAHRVMNRQSNSRKSNKRWQFRYLPCKVEPGMFRDEFLVFVTAVDPAAKNKTIPVQLLVDDEEVVNLQGRPLRGQPVNAWLRVSLASAQRGFAVVVLPQPGIPVGEDMIVKEDWLQASLQR